ncbi:MAG: hypothetical protein R3F30_01825 [Planctomycetota bacterium]
MARTRAGRPAPAPARRRLGEPDVEDPDADDLGLWRELKVELDALDLEGRGLERLAAELDELEARIAAGRLEEADALVGRSLARVLRFPRHRPGWRSWAPVLVAAVLGLLGALWALAA